MLDSNVLLSLSRISPEIGFAKSPNVGGGNESCRQVHPGFKVPFIGLGESPRTEQLFPRCRSSYIDIGFVQQDTFKTVVSSKYSNLLLEGLEPFLVRQFRRCNLHRSHPERSSTLVCSSGLTVETVVSVLSTLARLILLGTNLDGYTTLRSVKMLGCRRRRILDLATQ